jgi:hypothetical protein
MEIFHDVDLGRAAAVAMREPEGRPRALTVGDFQSSLESPETGIGFVVGIAGPKPTTPPLVVVPWDGIFALSPKVQVGVVADRFFAEHKLIRAVGLMTSGLSKRGVH